MARWLSARSSTITGTVGPTSPRTRSAAEVEQTIASTRRTSRPNAGPVGGAGLDPRDVRQGRVDDRVLQVVGGLALGGDHAHPRPRRELGQAVEGFQMHLGEERDDRNPQAAQPALHLREMAKAGDRGGPVIGRRLPSDGGRQLLEEHLVHADREVRLELPPKEVQLRRTALDEEHRDGPPGGRPTRRRPRSRRPPPRRRGSSRGPPRGSPRPSERPRGESGTGGRDRTGVTNTPFPRRASTCPLRLRSSIARATVFGLMPRKPASSRMLGNAWSRGTPPPSMTCFSCSVNCQRIGIGL